VLHQRLKGFLGNLDEYWSEGDLEAGDGLKTGSLADDITDMYFDLKRGLAHYETGKRVLFRKPHRFENDAKEGQTHAAAGTGSQGS